MPHENPVLVRQSEQAIEIESAYWRVRHDLQRGGCISAVRILYGSNSNLLAAPSAAQVDQYREDACPAEDVRVDHSDEAVTLTIRGQMCDAAGSSAPHPLRYTHIYRYTPWSIKHTFVLDPQGACTVRHFSATRLAFSNPVTDYVWGTSDFVKAKPRYMHIVGPHYDDIFCTVPAGDDTGTLQEDGARPWSVAFIRRGLEGMQWCGDSNVYAWDELAPQRRFSLTRTGGGLELDLAPIAGDAGATLAGRVTLGWYWFLPNIRRLGRRRLYEVVVQTNPFPSTEMLDRWRERGVDLIRIHNDSDYVNSSDDYWHDGMHPPFGPEKMQRLAEFVAAVHARGMRIIPYFSGWELSPDTPLFAQHAQAWYAPSRPGGKKRYTPNSGAGVWGGLMCPDSGWGQALEHNIRAAIDELGFDGFYLDWSSPGPCFNERHRPGQHNGIDGLLDILERLRRDYPDKTIVIHSGGQLMWLFHHNLADQYVTLEEGKKQGGYTPESLEEYPVTADYMGVGSASAVPNIFHGQDRTNLYRGMVHAVLLGLPPYTYYFQAEACGYANWREEADDPRGIIGAMHSYASFDWSRYHFYSVSTGVAQSESAGVGVAVYLGDGAGILVAGNLNNEPAAPTTASVRLDKTHFGPGTVNVPVPALEGWRWTFIPFNYSDPGGK
ncbi:MAG: DUF6259 domain-containing protein [Chloroflexi bacterium]|nr:DUF6259 domain-containing protein [Chloroflexota bacterium]